MRFPQAAIPEGGIVPPPPPHPVLLSPDLKTEEVEGRPEQPFALATDMRAVRSMAEHEHVGDLLIAQPLQPRAPVRVVGHSYVLGGFAATLVLWTLKRV